MRMNRVEKMLMGSWMKTWLLCHYEAPLLERLGGRAQDLHVLEVGCGDGVGVDVILKRFGARTVDALDIDPQQIELARRRLTDYSQDRVHLMTGDVTEIPAPDDSYDSVYDFALLHHVVDWRRAITEIRRVLRPGGRFFFEEVPGSSLASWPARVLLDHPSEDRFEAAEFMTELRSQGFESGPVTERVHGHLFLGVGRRASRGVVSSLDEGTDRAQYS